MLNDEQIKQFSEIIEIIGSNLDITKTQYDNAVRSYQSVGKWLAKSDSPLSKYSPDIMPQGSFMLGTMIKPIDENVQLDIDLVCQFNGKLSTWTQSDLKKAVGEQLKAYTESKKMESPLDKRRCWEMNYSDSANFHMDVLPSIISSDYRVLLEKSFRSNTVSDVDELAIRITDKKEENYYTESNPDLWLKSNPFGYSRWFFDRADISLRKSGWISEAVEPVPTFREDKLPLQRVVQILKRHRDIHYGSNEHKPISIIITTLAAQSYDKESNIWTALTNIVNGMKSKVIREWSTEYERYIWFVRNPVNSDENFADKWPTNPEKERVFFEWLGKLEEHIVVLESKRGIDKIGKKLGEILGERLASDSIKKYGELLLEQRDSGILKMAQGTGIITTGGNITIPKHNPYGKNN